jgi:hypothetical protein
MLPRLPDDQRTQSLLVLAPSDGFDYDEIRSSVSRLRPEDPGALTVSGMGRRDPTTPLARCKGRSESSDSHRGKHRVCPEANFTVPYRTGSREKRRREKKNLICFQGLKQPSVTWLRACFSETENPSGSCKDQNRARLTFEFETDTNRRVTRGAGGNQFFFPKTHDAPIPMGHSTQWLHG